MRYLLMLPELFSGSSHSTQLGLMEIVTRSMEIACRIHDCVQDFEEYWAHGLAIVDEVAHRQLGID
jgi:hypothetical protein